MTWIQTSRAHAWDYAKPFSSRIELDDVLWSLANINRFNGHAGPYSVAQHTVLGARALEGEKHTRHIIREWVGHDLHEAMIGDWPSPLKRMMGAEFHALEARVRDAFVARFSLDHELPAEVKRCDLRMLMTEKRDLMLPEPQPWGVTDEPYDISIMRWAPEYAFDQLAKLCKAYVIR